MFKFIRMIPNSVFTVTYIYGIKVVGNPRYGCRPQMGRQMSRVGLKWVGTCCLSWTCLPNVTLECTSLAKRFPLKTANLNNTSTTKTRTNKYTRRLRYTERTLLKMKNIKTWTTKYQRINTKPMKTKIYSQIKMHLKNITKIEKYKKNEVQSIKALKHKR